MEGEFRYRVRVYEKLSEELKEELGDDYNVYDPTSYLIKETEQEDGSVKEEIVANDYMEPEDAYFFRDLSYVPKELNSAIVQERERVMKQYNIKEG